ncbi:MAG: hypothetical protein GQ564_17480 [Bacteroidales bacterium]|nr:hypothetical protein [Bacteroidales bacterium]
MRVKISSIIVSLTFSLICHYTYSSELDTTKILKKYNHGYIVTLNADTIKGFVNYKSYLYLKFIDANGNKNKFTASKIKGFGDYDKKRDMESFYIDHRDNIYFLERVVTGSISLYLNYENVNSHSYIAGSTVVFIDNLISKTMYSVYYFTKDSKLNCIPQANKQFIETMCEYLNDDQELINRIRTNSYRFKDLIQIIKEYNSNKIVLNI